MWERVQKGRLTPASQARVLKVLRFDAACGCEGCGIALSGDEYICPPAAAALPEAAKTITTGPAARWKCTPIPLRGLPPEGEVCSMLTLELT